MGDGGECLLGLDEGERGKGLRVGRQGGEGVRGDSLRIGEEGNDEDELEDTSVLVQFFCLGVCCCCCCRLEVKLFSLLVEQSTASN